MALAVPRPTPYVDESNEKDGFILSVIAELAAHPDRSLLIVEDDKAFLERLARAMEGRGFAVTDRKSVV